MNLKKIGKVFTSKFVETGPSSYKKIIYRVVVSQRLRNTALEQTNILSLLGIEHNKTQTHSKILSQTKRGLWTTKEKLD